MLRIYSSLMGVSAPILRSVLENRSRRGKEDPVRLGERMGVAGAARPPGRLAWFHAASVGESQSTLILIEALLRQYPDLNVLVTTGTVSSAALMQKRLPRRTVHQYYPLDHPAWVARFLDHWQPDLALWMESEIWPNMLTALKKRQIPAALVNARLSPQSFKRWKLAGGEMKELLSAFAMCLTQTEEDAAYYRALGAVNVTATDNLKYSAAPLPADAQQLQVLKQAIDGRPLWCYASTHDAEEELACRLHASLMNRVPNLLTIIVPRHPERRAAIVMACEKYGLRIALRGEGKMPPAASDQIYIADTLGEMGLFYSIAPLACIGRSFSSDGGGGHNPIEAAQLDCAVLHGPHVQNLSQIFAEFDKAGAALMVKDEQDFQNQLGKLLTDAGALDALRGKGKGFAQDKGKVIDTVLAALRPLMRNLTASQTKCA